MNSVALRAYPRARTKRTGLKSVRTNGRVPAVIYGRLNKPQNLEVPGKELKDLVHHSANENILVDLTVEGDGKPTRLALVQEMQHHPLSGEVLHVDFHEVSATEKVTVQVPVETVGEPVGVKTGGGVLEHVLFRVRARALPKDLPVVLAVDVSHLEIGHSIHIGDIKPPAGVEILGDKKIVVISVAMPKSEEEEAAEAAAAAGTEPEMIKEKKEEGAEGAAPEKGAEKGAEKGDKKPAAAGDKAAAKPAAAKPAAAGDKKKEPEKAEKKK